MEMMTVGKTSYQVINLLGHGKGGYSYLVTDGLQNYVLKQIHHEPCDYYAFGNKIEAEKRDYERLGATGILLPKMYALDEENETILKEYIEGPTIYELVVNDQMKPDYMRQIKEICKKVYAVGLNIDYFPTNFVVQNEKIYYIDYECNDYMAEWNFENWGIKYWSKTPEMLAYIQSHNK